MSAYTLNAAQMSLPSRGAWIEIRFAFAMICIGSSSLPSRGAWIEIHACSSLVSSSGVAPLAGSVD